MERLTFRSFDGLAHATRVGYYDMLEKLCVYEDAEEQGLLIRLPCKVGDTVYGIAEHANGKLEIVDSILYGIEQILQLKDVIGKGLYLTKEEAEQALAKMKEV